MDTSIGMIAHDLTGALDSLAAFVEIPGDTVISLIPGDTADNARNIAIVTGTQTASSNEAYATVRNAARELAGRHIFKRVGSTLRGNIGPEIRAVLDESGRRAVVCSALPREGRTVADGTGLLNSVPLHLTEYALDPTVPCRESSLLTILRNAGVDVSSMPLSVVRAGKDVLVQRILACTCEAVVVDASTDDDMRIIGHTIAALGSGWCACASSGLSPHLAEALGRHRVIDRSHLRHPGDTGLLAVIGTTNPVSAAQVRQLNRLDDVVVIQVEAIALCAGSPETAGWKEEAVRALERGYTAVLTTSLSEVVPHLFNKVAPSLGALAAEIAARSQFSTVLLSGGMTALNTCTALGIRTLEVLGEIEPGVVSSRGIGSDGVVRTIAGKAGGFGKPDILVRLLEDKR